MARFKKIEIPVLTEKFRLALQWRADVASGDMIEAPSYTNEYMGFDQISQQELNVICDAANLFYKGIGSNLRIGNSMGELIPFIEV